MCEVLNLCLWICLILQTVGLRYCRLYDIIFFSYTHKEASKLAIIIVILIIIGLGLIDEEQKLSAIIRTSFVAHKSGRMLVVHEANDPTPFAGIDKDEIWITSGLFELTDSEGEFAGVLAHELGHRQGFFDNLRKLIFFHKDLFLIFVLGSSFRIKDLNSLILLFTGYAISFLFLQRSLTGVVKVRSGLPPNKIERMGFSFSRHLQKHGSWIFVPLLLLSLSFSLTNLAIVIGQYILVIFYTGWTLKEEEHRADEKGIEIMKSAGYDSSEYMSMVIKLSKLPGLAKRSLFKYHFCDGHPTMQSRIKRINAIITKQATN